MDEGKKEKSFTLRDAIELLKTREAIIGRKLKQVTRWEILTGEAVLNRKDVNGEN